jgi:hypothetical protein
VAADTLLETQRQQDGLRLLARMLLEVRGIVVAGKAGACAVLHRHGAGQRIIRLNGGAARRERNHDHRKGVHAHCFSP